MTRQLSTEQRHLIDRPITESDDEEIDEDAAFNSDDEAKYGSLFVSPKQSIEGKSDESSDDDSDGSSSVGEEDWAQSGSEGEQEDDGGQYMLDLLNNLDGQVPGEEHRSNKRDKDLASGKLGEEIVTPHPSEANSSGKKLTLDSLMSGIADTPGFTEVQRSMRALMTGNGGNAENAGGKKMLVTTPAPLPRVVSERASRKVHYQATTEDVSQWREVIHDQRNAETLDFRVNKGGEKASTMTNDRLIEKFQARTEFEEELERALEVAGMKDEQAMQKREKKRLLDNEREIESDGWVSDEDDIENGINEDDLGETRISLEEYKRRHGELAKMRALLFYDEQKRHRINKIKSKKYRKIRNRQREREKDAESNAAKLDDNNFIREKIEQEEMDRMKERMTLAHKNTSKWARRVLRRGAKIDIEERRALSFQIAKGEELRNKIMGKESEGEVSENEAETEKDLLRQARLILAENDNDVESALNGEKKKGLFQLEFMKRGMEAQRVRAREEARRLLEELEANEAAAMLSEDEKESGQKTQKKHHVKVKVASEAETSKIIPEGKLVATSLQFGKASEFSMGMTGNIDLSKNSDILKNDNNTGTTNDNRSTSMNKKIDKKKHSMKDMTEDPKSSKSYDQDQANPWIVSTDDENDADTAEPRKLIIIKDSTDKSPTSNVINVNHAASLLIDPLKKKDKKSLGLSLKEDTTISINTSDVALTSLSQAELVCHCFAAPANLEAQEEFQKEKERMKERDDPTRPKKEEKVLSGWGNWAGVGAPPPRMPHKIPKHLKPPVKKPSNAPKRKDDGMSTVIINEKRLKKTAQFQLAEIPYPYRSRQEYEKSMAGNIGQEWNTIKGVKEMTRPSVIVRPGKIIKPIAKKSKAKRAPAKF